jgi:hypothetical protein
MAIQILANLDPDKLYIQSSSDSETNFLKSYIIPRLLHNSCKLLFQNKIRTKKRDFPK